MADKKLLQKNLKKVKKINTSNLNLDLSNTTLKDLSENPTVTDLTLQHNLNTLREQAREHITSKLLWFVGLLYGGFLVVGSVLVYLGKIDFRDMLDLILALGAFSGLLSTAVNFYFKI